MNSIRRPYVLLGFDHHVCWNALPYWCLHSQHDLCLWLAEKTDCARVVLACSCSRKKLICQCHCLDWVWSCDANMHALFMCVLGKKPSVATCAKRPNCLLISAMPTLGYDKSQRIQLRCPNSQFNVGHIGHWQETCRTSSSKQHKSHAHNVWCWGTT